MNEWTDEQLHEMLDDMDVEKTAMEYTNYGNNDMISHAFATGIIVGLVFEAMFVAGVYAVIKIWG